MGGMVVVVAVVVVGIPVVVIMVVVGPGGASRLYALPLLLACMSCNCILFARLVRVLRRALAVFVFQVASS